MIQGQREAVPLYCPRCGGLMHKAAGSTLYWHADTNHPRCDITNIVATVLEAENTAQSPLGPVERKRKKGR